MAFIASPLIAPCEGDSWTNTDQPGTTALSLYQTQGSSPRFLACPPVLKTEALHVLACPPVSFWFRECVTRL